MWFAAPAGAIGVRLRGASFALVVVFDGEAGLLAVDGAVGVASLDVDHVPVARAAVHAVDARVPLSVEGVDAVVAVAGLYGVRARAPVDNVIAAPGSYGVATTEAIQQVAFVVPRDVVVAVSTLGAVDVAPASNSMVLVPSVTSGPSPGLRLTVRSAVTEEKSSVLPQ